ncbi:MAG TPA: hypothetical protein VF006_30135 [Longimicrobium sp.]
MADEMGVLPVEVTAWESGAIAADLRQAALIRWHIEQAEYEARLPRSHCYWSRANEARLQRMWEQGLVSAARAYDEMEAHARECGECMYVKILRRDMPPPPQPPAEPGFRGWMRSLRARIGRLPVWLRLPLQTADFALHMAAVYMALLLVSRIRGDAPSLSPTGMVVLGAFILWIGRLGKRLLPLAARRPYLAGQLFAAGIALPAILLAGLLGEWNLGSAEGWVGVGVMSLFAGGVAGHWVAKEEPEHETNADPSWDEEERVVEIPQQAHWFKP